MKAIILAGGKGKRLHSSAEEIPKPLVEVNGKTILKRQIEHLEDQGFSDIRLSLGYKSDQIISYLDKEYEDGYEYIVEPDKLGTGGAIKFASKDINDPFLVLNVDDLADIDYTKLVEHHSLHDLPATISVLRVEDARGFGLVDLQKQDGDKMKINKFLEKPEERRSGYINIGHYVLSPEVFESVENKKFSIEYDIFPDLAKNNKISAFIHGSKWKEVGTESSLKEARENGTPI